MEIKAEVKNINNILVDGDKFYQIPDYQRPYSWNKDHVSVLVDDLVEAYIDSKKEDNEKETYFCGSLVLVSGGERFDIIDGQQRITTFIIISCVFREIFHKLQPKAKKYIEKSIQDEFEDDKRKLKFLTDEHYQVDFEETVLKKGMEPPKTKNFEKEFPDNKYLQNAHYIQSFLEEKIEEQKLDDNFVMWFFENVVLTVITCPSQDSAIRIFDVLNDRGMPLNSTDILKAELMRKLDSSEDRNAFKIKWQKISQNLKYEEFDLEGMLNTYRYYKTATNPKRALHKELSDAFKKENQNPLEIITEIGDFSEAYIEIRTAQEKHLYCLRYLKHKIYWSSILSTALFLEYPEIERLKSLLVAYYYQNWIAGATVARIKQTSFKIIQLIKDGKPIDEISSEMQSNLTKHHTTKTFKKEIEWVWFIRGNLTKAILLLIEYFSSDNSKKDYIPIDSTLHLEHVLPLNPSNPSKWREIFNNDELEKWKNSLANLTLLSGRKNSQAGNSSFEEKKKIYKDRDGVSSSFLITQYIMNCDKWDVTELEKRKNALIDKINKQLDLFDKVIPSLSNE